MLTRRELNSLLSEHNIKIRKRLGQNFLIDKNIKDKIINSVNPSKSDTILEIGAGLGQLTIDLANKAGTLYAVEKDKAICDILARRTFGLTNLILINRDILDLDFAEAASTSPLTIVGNLPYYITTPILERLIFFRKIIRDIFVTVQKEVALRIIAQKGTRDYSPLSIFLNYHTEPHFLFAIKRTSFYPEPDVDSAFLGLRVLPGPSVRVDDEEMFFSVVRRAFQQRRKTIMNSLTHKNAFGLSRDKIKTLLKGISIPAETRPEELSMAEFGAIADNIRRYKG